MSIPTRAPSTQPVIDVRTSPNEAGSNPWSRINGVVTRSGESGNRNAYRPLSQSQASFTSYSSRARCRTTSPRRRSTRRLQPAEQCGQTESPYVRSNGRAANR